MRALFSTKLNTKTKPVSFFFFFLGGGVSNSFLDTYHIPRCRLRIESLPLPRAASSIVSCSDTTVNTIYRASKEKSCAARSSGSTSSVRSTTLVMWSTANSPTPHRPNLGSPIFRCISGQSPKTTPNPPKKRPQNQPPSKKQEQQPHSNPSPNPPQTHPKPTPSPPQSTLSPPAAIRRR